MRFLLVKLIRPRLFDLVQHSILFKKLLEKKLPKIFLRLLIVMYLHQFAKVRWNGVLSEAFALRNGCKQGAVLSGILYNFYVNGLFQLLRERKSGCWVGLHYVGIVGYADDDWLLAPSLNALQDMLVTCEEYNLQHGLQFSTDKNPEKSKTKCIAYLKKDRNLPQLMLCGNKLPWVASGKHVGQNVTNQVDGMKKDILVKRAKFIDKNNTLRQEFSFAHPDTLLQLNQIYNSDFTGSCVWDLFSREQQMLENSYNTAVRLMLGLPMNSHRYLIEPLSGRKHLKSDLIQRFSNFLEKIEKSNKQTLKYVLDVVSNDVRSVTGKNLVEIKKRSGKEIFEKITVQESKKAFRDIPQGENWRIGFAREIIECRHQNFLVPGFEAEELDEILNWICTSGPS